MKLYDSILTSLRTFFGMVEGTESELHQALADAGTLEQMQDKARADAKAEFEAVVSDLTAKVGANTEALDGLKAEMDTLKADLKAAQDALAEKQTALEASEAKVTAVSTELADLKVAKAAQKTAKLDEGVKTETEKTEQSGKNVITGEAFMAMFQ